MGSARLEGEAGVDAPWRRIMRTQVHFRKQELRAEEGGTRLNPWAAGMISTFWATARRVCRPEDTAA